MQLRRSKPWAALSENQPEVPLQKYGQHLKNSLQQISDYLAQKKQQKSKVENEQRMPEPLALKKHLSIEKSTPRSVHPTIRNSSRMAKHPSTGTEQRPAHRQRIYGAQACRQESEFEPEDQTEEGNAKKSLSNRTTLNETMSFHLSRSGSQIEETLPSLSIADFSLGEKLGSGKFGEVFVAMHRKTGFVCAIKRVSRRNIDKKLVIQLAREVRIQSHLSHPNIVKLYTFFTDDKYVYLVQELCYSGQLFAFLRYKKSVPQEMTRIIVQQVCKALDYMHECEIIHRDIKPQNIIFQNGLIKICDFGWSISSKAMRETFCGTPLYVSPELLKRKNYNNKIDVWGVGILAYELLFGRVPFQITSQRDFVKIIEQQIKFVKSVSISEHAKDFIQVCLKKDPRDRYTVPELLQHPFIAMIDKPMLAEMY